MQAVKILVEEHEVILEMLDNLAAARDMLEKRDRLPREFFEKAIVFARDFTDKYHHFKEEYLLFGLLAQKMEGAFDTEIGVLRYEHESGRKLINQIEATIERYAREDDIATARLLENLAAYVSILKRHIYSEENVFFKMVEQELSEKEDNLLIKQFQQGGSLSDRGDFLSHSRKLVNEIGKMIGKLK